MEGVCTTCNGTGRDPSSHQMCAACHGTGTTP